MSWWRLHLLTAVKERMGRDNSPPPLNPHIVSGASCLRAQLRGTDRHANSYTDDLRRHTLDEDDNNNSQYGQIS